MSPYNPYNDPYWIAEMEDAEANARNAEQAEQDWQASLGICNHCSLADFSNGLCYGYKMPLFLIRGRKYKCKRYRKWSFNETEEMEP